MKKFILGSIFVCFIATSADAARSRLDLSREFCGDRYCGQFVNHQPDRAFKKAHKRSKIVTRKEIAKKPIQVASLGTTPAGEAPQGLLKKAEAYLGMTAHQIGVRSTLWCSAFIRKLSNATGVDDRAISWLRKPRTHYGCINCIAVMAHHVGIVKGYKNGNPILISGNYRRRVGIGVYSKNRILAYVTI